MPKTLAEKRLEAEERREAYANRSLADQLKQIENRPGMSQRERQKLLAGKPNGKKAKS